MDIISVIKNKGTQVPKIKDEYRPTIHDDEWWVEFGKLTLIVGVIYALNSYLFF